MLPAVFCEILPRSLEPCRNRLINGMTLQSLSMMLFESALVEIIDNVFPVDIEVMH